jgi:hypothetical protein
LECAADPINSRNRADGRKTYWANFVKTRDPNNSGNLVVLASNGGGQLPFWKHFNTEDFQIQSLTPGAAGLAGFSIGRPRATFLLRGLSYMRDLPPERAEPMNVDGVDGSGVSWFIFAI